MLNSKQDWLQVLPYVGLLGCVTYIAYSAYKKPRSRVNNKIDMDKDKVVNMVDIEDVGDKTAYCRCWKSAKFPLCDGTHNKHNAENCDNVGPLVMRKKE